MSLSKLDIQCPPPIAEEPTLKRCVIQLIDRREYMR
jgi:hypothetical protein